MSPTTTRPKAPGTDNSSAVPQGYKRTEAGLIPGDWNLGTLGGVGRLQSGNGFPIAFQGQQVGDYPFFKVSDMNNYGNELYMKVAHHWIDEETRRRLGATAFPAGSIVFAKIGAAIFLERKRLLSQDSCLDNNMMVFILSDRRASDRFFHYLFLRIELGRLVSTTALPSLSAREIGAIRVPLPPPDEQRAIAETLSDVDRLLAALEALIAKKRAIKQGTMQQLLTGRTRLPGFGGEWAEKPLAALAIVTMGQSPPSRFYNQRGEGLPLIQGNADLENRRAIARVWTTQSNKRCNAGDLLLTVRAPVGAVGIATTDACLGRGVCGLKSVGNALFLLQALLLAEPRWKTIEQGSTFTSANSRQVGQFILSVPEDDHEQKAIATVLFDMDAEIAALERLRDKARGIKQGMMQQLLTGRIRLVKPEPVQASG